MIIKRVNLKLPEGTFNCSVIQYERRDRKLLLKLYNTWIKINSLQEKLYGRTINLPESLSEGAFCLRTGCVRMLSNRIPADTSFDCYNLMTKKRIQIKAASIKPDLTSFGPDSVWDELYFGDFFITGKRDGRFAFYKIDNRSIYNRKINKTQFFRDQQSSVRRPRFSIYSSIIVPKQLKPIYKGKLFK